jgi:ABC-type uncharacterized transport system substrate-binding protein
VIDRRAFLGTLGLLAAPRVAGAQPERRVPRVALLVMARNPGVETAFPSGLADLGYVEGRDIVIEWRSADGRSDRLPALAAEVVASGAQVIVAGGPEARRAAMNATRTIPIVAVGGNDPVAEGWAATLARPGGNVTGLTVTYPELLGKKLELLKNLLPGLVRIGVVRDGAIPPSEHAEATKVIQAASRSMNLDVKIIEIQGTDFEAAFRQAHQDRRQALVMIETAMVFAHRGRLAELARSARVPTIGEWTTSAGAGYLASYGADLGDLLRRAAVYVDRILKGANPGTLPIERPTKFALVLNLKTAKALGLTIPRDLLLRADQVIE